MKSNKTIQTVKTRSKKILSSKQLCDAIIALAIVFTFDGDISGSESLSLASNDTSVSSSRNVC